ncbi:hypothetical protein Ciccas_000941 [Cichlidogyrus casuarinus]|uniref:C2 domain-containing protein n=1 Tax=Cichlidogyrus casuarinus TaxID=1844966 RepID=A0ABD2QNR3_9PLAT
MQFSDAMAREHTFCSSGDNNKSRSSEKICKSLELRVIAAKNLKSLDISGESDPYCVVKLNRVIVGKTIVIKNCNNPTWNEMFRIPMPGLNGSLKFVIQLFSEFYSFHSSMSMTRMFSGAIVWEL